MGKEVKIGVAVVLGLFIVLCVVLAIRLTDSKAKTVAGSPSLTDLMQRDIPTLDLSKSRTPASSPTLVKASAGSGLSLKPPADSDRWSVAGDGESHKDSGDAGKSAAMPPSLMPNPSASALRSGSSAPANAVADPVSKSPAPGKAGDASPAGLARLASSSAPPPMLPRNTAAISLGDGALRGTAVTPAAHVAPMPMPMAPPAPAAAAGSAYSDSGRFASPSPPAMSTYRQSNRYGYPQQADAEPQGRPAAADGGASPAAAAARGRSGNPWDRREEGNLSDRREEGVVRVRHEESIPGGRREQGTYKVQPNDSYWSISEKTYGSGAYFKALAEYNRERVPRDDRLQVGTVLQVPAVEELAGNYPELCPKASHRKAAAGRAMSVSTTGQRAGQRLYVVESGDTLMDIARRQLGKASRWGELYELNRERLGEDHDYLTPGMELLLPEPAAGRGESLTQRPGAGYTR